VVLNSAAGAELIREATGRPCTRQNLEKLCRAGRLPKSCVSLNPIRVDGDLLLAEYRANVDPRQANTINPGPGIAKTQPVPAEAAVAQAKQALRRQVESLPAAAIPDFNKSRARKEHYQAELAELELGIKQKELVPATDVKIEAARLARQVRDLLLLIPSRTAAMVATMQDPEDVRALLQGEIEAALRGLNEAS